MTILLIHTGGTIGMVATDAGFAPADGIVETCVAGLLQDGEVSGKVDIHALTPLIDSANATPQDWNRILRTIAARYDRYDAFVVTHGTDTLAYTAPALSFALEGLDKPVVLTGSMLPLSVDGNDGRRNLRDALVAAHGAEPGVWVQFAGKLLHGCRVRKSHSRRFDAFAAEASDRAPRHGTSGLRVATFAAPDVAVLAVAPGVSARIFDLAMRACDGVVLRCYGSGTAPENIGLSAALKTAADRRIPVIAVSQCPEGGMAIGTYAASAILRDGGAIDGRDMTVEAAYAKMQFALSCTQDPHLQHGLLVKSLCGEFTPQS